MVLLKLTKGRPPWTNGEEPSVLCSNLNHLSLLLIVLDSRLLLIVETPKTKDQAEYYCSKNLVNKISA